MKQVIILISLIIFESACFGNNHLYDKYKIEKREKLIREQHGGTYNDWEVFAQEAFNVLYQLDKRKKFKRSISSNINDWPRDINKFVRIDYPNIPILNCPDLNADNLKVLGFTQYGELLEFIDSRMDCSIIGGPGNWGPKNAGDWYQIKTLDGQDGWILAKPYTLGYSFAAVVEREIPQPVDNNTSGSNFPFWTIIIILIVVIGIIALVSSYSHSSSNSGSSNYSSTSSSYYDSTESSYGSYASSGNSDVSDVQEENNENNGGYEHGKCPDCDGLDLSSWGFSEKGNGICSNCHGTGLASSDWLVKFATFGTEDDIPCEECSGTKQCQTCGGKGVI